MRETQNITTGDYQVALREARKVGYYYDSCDITDESIEKIEALLNSRDEDFRMLGMRLFYELCNLWPDDVSHQDYWASQWLRTLARLSILKKRRVYHKTIK